MNLNFSDSLKGLDGQPILDNGKEKLLNEVCINALGATHLNERGQPENPPPMEKERRLALIRKIYLGGWIDLAAEEIVLIKQMVDKSYGTLWSGLIKEMLEK